MFCLEISIVLKSKVEPNVQLKKPETYKCRELTNLYFFRIVVFNSLFFSRVLSRSLSPSFRGRWMSTEELL